jgi:hypothetical protein
VIEGDLAVFILTVLTKCECFRDLLVTAAAAGVGAAAFAAFAVRQPEA